MLWAVDLTLALYPLLIAAGAYLVREAMYERLS